MEKSKLIRITTVPQSLGLLIRGQHRFMSDHFEVIGISGEGPELQDVAQNEGIRVIPVDMKRTVSPWHDLKSVYSLYRIFRREKPLIVHTHTPKAGMAGMIAAALARVPVRLHTVAGLPLMEQKGVRRWILDRVEKITYGCATRVYPNSIGLMDYIVGRKYCKPSKLMVLGSGSSNGIDTSYFDPDLFTDKDISDKKQQLGIAPGDFVFIFVGRIVKDKGVNELIKAFSYIHSKYAHTKLILAGAFEKERDPVEPYTEREISQNGSIIHLGFQKDIRILLALSDVMVFPSYREGFPNAVMQACSMSLPVIATDINGCNEMIEDGKTGHLIPAKDAGALIGKMEHYIENADTVKTRGEDSRNTMKEKFEQRYIWELLLEQYRYFESKVKK